MDTSASEALLSCILHDPMILVETNVQPDMMPGRHSLIFAVMKELSLSGIRPDFDTIYMDSRLKDCSDLLLLICERSYTASNWKSFEDQVIEGWKSTKLANLGLMISGSKEKSKDLVNTIELALLELGRVTSGSDIVKIEDLYLPWVERFSERCANAGQIPGISWGFDNIDSSTMGARASQFVVIGARPSEGKSAIGVQMLRHQGLNLGVPVGLITIESSKEEVVTRFIAGGTPVDSMKTALGYVGSSDKSSIARFIGDASSKKEKIFIYDRPGVTLTEVRSACRRMVLNSGVKVIYIDYLQLIRVPGKKDKIAEVLEVSNGLKEIARELKVCVVALAQLRRDDKRERPTMGSIQWSSQIEQDADQIWLLYHKRDNGQITESRVILEKVRDGVTCDVPVIFEKQFVRFREI